MNEVTFDFTGKNFVVIGASSGMGRQTALDLAAAGAHVLAVARNEKKLAEVRENYPSLIETTQIDVTTASEDDWSKVFDSFVGRYGKINGEVYTAGTGTSSTLRFFDEIAARNVMETGFWGALKNLRIATKKKYAIKGSSYVLFSSVAAHTGERSLAVYAATKAALKVAVWSLAHDLERDKHRINTISPGFVKTGMTLRALEDEEGNSDMLKRHFFGIGEPTDVTGMVLFLLSDRAHWITGEDFVVDGGYLRGAWR